MNAPVHSDASAAQAAPRPAPRRPGWRDVLRGLRQRKVAVMLLLGLSAGLPFMRLFVTEMW